MTDTYDGGCHCGNIRVAYRTSRPVSEWAVRACQCTFCRKHGIRATSDPDGSIGIAVADERNVSRYRFGLGITDFLVCRVCGVYVCALVEEPDGLLATLVVNTLDLPQHGFPEPVPAHYDDETGGERLARRRLRWTPAAMMSPSALADMAAGARPDC